PSCGSCSQRGSISSRQALVPILRTPAPHSDPWCKRETVRRVARLPRKTTTETQRHREDDELKARRPRCDRPAKRAAMRTNAAATQVPGQRYLCCRRVFRIADGRLRRPPVALLSLCLCASVVLSRAAGSLLAQLSPLLASGRDGLRRRHDEAQW